MNLQDLKNIKLNDNTITHGKFYLELGVNYDFMYDNESINVNHYSDNNCKHISIYDKLFKKQDVELDYDNNETYFCSLIDLDVQENRDIIYDSFIFPYNSIFAYDRQSIFINKHGKLYVLYNDTYYVPIEVYTEKNNGSDLYWYSYINLIRIDKSEIDKLTTEYIEKILKEV